MSKQHNMKLFNSPFNLIRDGLKTIEVRCYDEKRRQLEVGDTIIFSHYDEAEKTMRVVIRDIQVFDTFAELYSSFPMSMFGHPNSTVNEMVVSAQSIYSPQEERQYGTVAIVFEKT